MNLTRHNVLGIGLAASLLAALGLAAANFLGEDGENGGVGPYVVTLAVSIVVTAVVFGWAIPRTERPARDGIVAGALALLAIAVYWTGIPFVLGPAAIALGLLGRARTDTRGSGTVAVVLGALATLGAVAAVLGDQLS
ncbi:MAG TPA: hypothetical protein VIA10_01460 [Gaiellaceae bacterium]